MSEEKDLHVIEEPEAAGVNEYEDEKPSGFGPKHAAIIGIIVAVVIAGIIFIVWRRSAPAAKTETAEAEKNEAGTVKFLMEQQWLIQMKLAQVEEQTVSRQITSIGRVVPATNSQANVSTPVAGVLSGRGLPQIGQYVRGGQAIAVVQQTATASEQIQNRTAMAQVDAQKLQVEAQKSQIAIENARLESDRRQAAGDVEITRVRLESSKREADRMQRLFDGKAASEKQLQAARSEREVAQNTYDSAVKRRDALGAARPIVPSSLNVGSVTSVSGSHTISAPFGGYITKVNKSLGEQVNPGDAIVEISNLDTVYVEAPIFERDLNILGGSRTATFTTSAYPQEFKGTILDLGATIDEQTRAANLIFLVDNPGRALRLGMQANVRLDAEQEVTAMMVPKDAVLEHEGKRIVYVLLSGEEFQRREVTVGDEYGDKIAILSGLEKGERVVTQGALQLKLQELRPADAGAHSHET